MLSFLKSIPQTFYSAPFYRDLLISGKGVGLGFVLFITLLAVTERGVQLYKPFTTLWSEQKAMFDSLPQLEVKDGLLYTDGNTPYRYELLKEYESGHFFIVIDTNNNVSDEDTLIKKMQDERILILVNKNAVSFYSPDTQSVRISTTEKNKNTIITHERWIEIGNDLVTYILPLGLLFVISTFFIVYGLIILFGGVLLFIVSPLFKVETSFKSLMRLSAAAAIPPSIASTILLPDQRILVLLWFGFAAFGLLASKTTSPKGESTS